MLRRVSITIITVAIILSGLMGCQAPSATPAPTKPPAATAAPAPAPAPSPSPAAFKWPDSLTIISTSGAGNAVAIAWSTPLSRETGMRVRITTEDSQMLRHLAVKNGEAFTTGEMVPPDMMQAVKGYASKEGGPWQARIMYPIAKADSGFATTRDSGIKTPKDIKPGTRIIYMTFAPMGKTLMEALLAWANVDPKSVEWVPAASIEANATLLRDGRGDIAFGYPTTPYWTQAEAAPRGLAWINLDPKADPAGADRFAKLFPFFDGFAAMTQGPPSTRGVAGMINWSPYVVRADANADLVYNLVRWLDVNWDKYKDGHPWAMEMTIDNLMKLAEHNFVPLHDATVKYLKEKGKWTDAHEKRRQDNIANITAWVDGYKTAMDQASQRGIPIDPNNEAWIKFWEDYKVQAKLPVLANFQKGLG